MLRARPIDREIVALAVPALGALAAEPLYLLVDTAIVGHLGTPELAAQALWLSLAVGALLVAVLVGLAHPLVSLVGGEGTTADLAARYVRIASLGVPMALIALAAQGWLRGVGDLRTPLIIVVVANVANVGLELLFVYGLDLGLDGSAIGTVIAQLGMGAAFAVLLLRAGRAASVSRAPRLALVAPLLRTGGPLVVRTGALLAAFALATAVAAGIGDTSVAAHQIAFQLFIFLALVLDALAIAGQVLVGRSLGAGDAGGAATAARRLLVLSVGAGCVLGVTLLATTSIVPGMFTEDPAVIAEAETLWPLFALMQPAAAAVFALDGILIGAGDVRYLAGSMVLSLAVFVPAVLLASAQEWGIGGVWAALLVLMAVRLATTYARFAGRRWAVVGAG